MATGREETNQQPYEGGGAGGKFRKRPFRRTTHTAPYDRPPTAFRNPNGGWISKLVDPAQKLIASSAHRLFSTVFRKRLPPPQPPSRGAKCEERDKQREAVATDSPEAHKGTFDISDGPSNSASGGELIELEQILKQKTFTRSEIDRLTALLHSRTADLASVDPEKRSEVVPVKPVASIHRLEGSPTTPTPRNRVQSEGFLKSPALENWRESQLVSTPAIGSTVLEGDASPTELVELAKSYMHKRPTSPSMLGFRSGAVKEKSSAVYTCNVTSKLPVTPLMPRNTGHAEARENGIITPKSRRRSAIYSMARTPYSRVCPSTTLKVVENAVDVNAGLTSSSQYAQDQSLSSRSKQGALKRTSSVMDSDIGSFGAIRRIRQKPNLLSSRGLSLAVSSSSLSSSRTGLGSEASPISKPTSFGEPACNSNKPSAETGDDSMPFTTVPSKSSDMASKILQQLDKMVSPRDKSSESKVLALIDKSPSKLSPSMLHGQALKILENVDSSKFLGDVRDGKNLDGLLNKIIPDALEFTFRKEDEMKENAPLKSVSAGDKFTARMNGTSSRNQKLNNEDSRLPEKDAASSLKTSVPAALNSVAYPPQKKQAFQMSAPEDFLDLDDDSFPNGDASDALAEGGEKMSFSLIEKKSMGTEYVMPEKASPLTEIKHAVSETKQKNDMGNSAGSMTAEKSTNLIFQSTSSPNTAVLPVVTNASSLIVDGATSLKESNVSLPTCNFAAAPIFNCGLKSADKVPQPQFTFSTSSSISEFGVLKSQSPSEIKPETSINLFAVAAAATDSVPNLSEADKADAKNNPNAGAPVRTSSTTTFSFAKTPGDVSLKNGSSATGTLGVFSNLSSQNSTTSSIFANSGSSTAGMMNATTLAFASSSSTLSTPTPAPSGPTTSVFKFASCVPSAAAPVSETSSASAASVFKFSTSSTAVSLVSEISSVPPADPIFKSESPAAAPISETSSASVASVFKFGSLGASTAFAPVSQTSDIVSEANKMKQDANLGNLSSAAAATESTASTLLGSTASSTSASQSQDYTTFAAGNASAPGTQVSSAATGVATFSQSIPLQFGSSASSPAFSLAGSTTFTSSSSPFNSNPPAKPFSSGITPDLGSSSLAEANGIVSSSSSAPSLFGSSWQAPKSSIFGLSSSTGFALGPSSTPATNSSPSTGFSFEASSTSSAAISSPSTGFSFGVPSSAASTGFSFGVSSSAASSSPSSGFSFAATSAPSMAASSLAVFGTTATAAMNGAPAVFGSSNGASSGSLFSFNSSSAATSTQLVSGNPSPTFAFGAPSSNNDQMNMEDSMAEDTVEASGSTASVFGQPVSPSPSGFVFGTVASSVGGPFQFGSQPNLANPQNPSPFQASGSLGLGEGNFSMGSGGGGTDKSNRKFVKVKHKQRKK